MSSKVNVIKHLTARAPREFIRTGTQLVWRHGKTNTHTFWLSINLYTFYHFVFGPSVECATRACLDYTYFKNILSHELWEATSDGTIWYPWGVEVSATPLPPQKCYTAIFYWCRKMVANDYFSLKVRSTHFILINVGTCAQIAYTIFFSASSEKRILKKSNAELNLLGYTSRRGSSVYADLDILS